MEKRTPHCKLAAVKALAAEGKVRATVSAPDGVVAARTPIIRAITTQK